MDYKNISKPFVLEPVKIQEKTEPEKSTNHVLLANETRRFPTIADYLQQHKLAVGNAQGEQLALEVYTAHQINRGPPGVFSHTNMHQEILTGMDERIGFGFLV